MRLISWSHLMLSDLIAMVGRLQAASFTSCVAFITVIVAIKRKDCHLSGFTFSNALHSFRTNGSIFLMSATHSLWVCPCLYLDFYVVKSLAVLMKWHWIHYSQSYFSCVWRHAWTEAIISLLRCGGANGDGYSLWQLQSRCPNINFDYFYPVSNAVTIAERTDGYHFTFSFVARSLSSDLLSLRFSDYGWLPLKWFHHL